jgi:hypothetical protein
MVSLIQVKNYEYQGFVHTPSSRRIRPIGGYPRTRYEELCIAISKTSGVARERDGFHEYEGRSFEEFTLSDYKRRRLSWRPQSDWKADAWTLVTLDIQKKG